MNPQSAVERDSSRELTIEIILTVAAGVSRPALRESRGESIRGDFSLAGSDQSLPIVEITGKS